VCHFPLLGEIGKEYPSPDANNFADFVCGAGLERMVSMASIVQKGSTYSRNLHLISATVFAL